jgi:hypothetical protein
MRQLLTALFCIGCFYSTLAQKDPEFPRGWVMYLEGNHGVATNFSSAPDLFVQGLRLAPQATVVPGHIRVGATVSGIFFNKKIDGCFGPNLVFKLASKQAKPMGSLLNIQLQLEHLWGTGDQRLLGGLLHIELGQFLVVGLTMHRDYGLNYWWFQTGLGYNLLRKKRKGLEDPMKQ